MGDSTKTRKYLLQEKDIPAAWYNILPDLPAPFPPYISPATMKPITPDELAVIFPMELIMQEFSPNTWVDIPGEIIDIYKLWRPSPLFRAHNLEKALDTPAHIYYKYEGVSPAGSHKPNTAIAQAYYNKKAGINKISTETGAGQWGSALALAGALLDVDIEVFMVRVSYDQKPYRKFMINTWGAKVHASPSNLTDVGRKILAENPDSPGSLGIAISEAVEVAAKNPDTNYSLGSVLNHVCMHQTIIGLEAQKQMEMAGEYPDVVIGCHGGGSNFAGLALPYVRDKIKGGKSRLKILAAEPSACPTLTKGKYTYDFGDTGEMAPITMMYTLGHKFIPTGIHAGGLRYHGASPLISLLLVNKIIEAAAFDQKPCFDSAVLFARTEGILPAPESAHAIQAAVAEALDAKEKGEKRVILFNLSGHGHFDLAAYDAYNSGLIKDVALPQSSIDKGLESLPDVK
ncbi:MAG TPA: TrpB-like pyridoxal phosphate-dependent enzyme [bacterium]|nr:TrpB-like pyridoxal phosphate-dependent enzyme [bacterium]